MTDPKPVKIDDNVHQALKEYSVFLKSDMGEVIKTSLMKNKEYKKFYDTVVARK